MVEIAKESFRTKKIRKKLLERCTVLDSLATDDLKQKKIEQIKERMYRCSFHRKVIKHKSFSLFDENKNSKELSMEVGKICREIEKRYF